MVVLTTTYFKESDWLLKNFYQSENGSNSYHGEQNRGYHVKEDKKLSETGVKSDPAFCLGPTIKKTNSGIEIVYSVPFPFSQNFSLFLLWKES